MAPRPGV